MVDKQVQVLLQLVCIFVQSFTSLFGLPAIQVHTQGGRFLGVTRNPLLKLIIFIKGVFTKENGKPWS